MAQVLDNILSSCAVGLDEPTVQNSLLGLGFTVVNSSGIIYSGSAGRQGFDLTSVPYTTDSIQWIASMTKFITAVCLLQLVSSGQITLYEDLRARIPKLGALPIITGFDDHGEAILVETTEPLTLHNLLTHTSGLTYDVTDPDLQRWSESINRTENAQSYSLEGFTTPLKFEPGYGWTYGTSLDWAGYVLEQITQQSLANYMKEHIFAPLGMESTSFNVSTIPNASCRLVDWATASANDSSLFVKGTSGVPRDFTFYSGGSGLYSSTADYGKFLLAMLNGELLDEETQKLVFSPALTSTEHEALQQALSGVNWDGFVPEILPKHAPLDHGYSGIINLEDSPGRRSKGSLMWSGLSNGRWWVDSETGIAAVMTMQLEPYGHPLAIKVFQELEEAVYQELI